MKLKFVKIRDDHVFAVPESQFRGFLMMKRRYSKEQMTKLEPIFQYMFHDLEEHTAIVKDKHYFKMMDWNVKLKGPTKDFSGHVETAARVCTGVDVWSDDEDEFDPNDEIHSSESERDSDIDSEADPDEVGPRRSTRRRRQRSPSPTKQQQAIIQYQNTGRVDPGLLGMTEDGRRIVNFDQSGGVTVSIASNLGCGAILSYIIICAVAVSLSLNGMGEFWDRWTMEGGVLPSTDAVSAVFGEPFKAHYEPARLVWFGLPEHEQTLNLVSQDINSKSGEHNLLAGVSADELVERFGGKVHGDEEMGKRITKIMKRRLLDSHPDEQEKIQSLIDAYTLGRSSKAPDGSGLLQYTKAFIRWQPADLLYGGAMFLVSSMEFEDFERAFVFMVNTAKLGIQDACGYLLSELPPEIVGSEQLLRQSLKRYSGVYIPEFAIEYMVNNVNKLYQHGGGIMNDPTKAEFIKQTRQMVKANFNDKKNKIRPALDRMSQAVSLFAASSFIGGMTVLNMVFNGIRTRYKTMNPNWKNAGRILFMDAFTILNVGLIMHISQLEVFAMTSVFNGKVRLEDIAGSLDSGYFHTVTTLQLLATYSHSRYYNLDNQNILRMALVIHDGVILRLNANGISGMPWATGAMVGIYILNGVRGQIADKGSMAVGFLRNRVVSLPSIYARFRELNNDDLRQQFNQDIMDFDNRVITNAWTGSNAVIKRLMKHPQMAALIRTHHLAYI